MSVGLKIVFVKMKIEIFVTWHSLKHLKVLLTEVKRKAICTSLSECDSVKRDKLILEMAQASRTWVQQLSASVMATLYFKNGKTRQVHVDGPNSPL